VKLMMTDECTI